MLVHIVTELLPCWTLVSAVSGTGGWVDESGTGCGKFFLQVVQIKVRLIIEHLQVTDLHTGNKFS